MLSKTEFLQLLEILKIKADSPETILFKDVTSAFKKLALILHPDKAGDGSTASFQRIHDAYDKIRKHFIEMNETTVDENDKFFFDKFEQFNYPFENKGSFTVHIEDSLADIWQECLSAILGIPTVRKNSLGTICDRYWKFKFGQTAIDITVHLYIKPKNKTGSKLMIQGSAQSLVCDYVFNEFFHYTIYQLNVRS